MAKNVLNVGNCSFDHGTIERLISANFDAQEAAVAAGAEPGFGKAELDRAETVEKLTRFLGS